MEGCPASRRRPPSPAGVASGAEGSAFPPYPAMAEGSLGGDARAAAPWRAPTTSPGLGSMRLRRCHAPPRSPPCQCQCQPKPPCCWCYLPAVDEPGLPCPCPCPGLERVVSGHDCTRTCKVAAVGASTPLPATGPVHGRTDGLDGSMAVSSEPRAITGQTRVPLPSPRSLGQRPPVSNRQFAGPASTRNLQIPGWAPTPASSAVGTCGCLLGSSGALLDRLAWQGFAADGLESALERELISGAL